MTNWLNKFANFYFSGSTKPVLHKRRLEDTPPPEPTCLWVSIDTMPPTNTITRLVGYWSVTHAGKPFWRKSLLSGDIPAYYTHWLRVSTIPEPP